ncbi:MAG TPA: SRPBCC family protein, partial [Urbifossiella sp.]|nr:SRPBCC family protein [Urbifossiella sp.]
MPGTLLAVAAKSAAGPDSAFARATDSYAPRLRSNISDTERAISLGVGAALVGYGLTGRNLNLLSLLAGGFGLYRAATGNCPGYQLLGVSTAGGAGAATAVRAGAGVRVEAGVTVNVPVDEVYRFWRQLSRLPEFMEHVVKVDETDATHSTWTAAAPLGMSVQWHAEVTEDQPNRLLAWRSLPGSDVDTAGSVRFAAAPSGQGTEVWVALKFDAPGGRLGRVVARLFGEHPDRTVRAD